MTDDLPLMARRSPDDEIRDALRVANDISEKKQSRPPVSSEIFPVTADDSGLHLDWNAGVTGKLKRAGQYFSDTMSGKKPMDVTSPEAVEAANTIAGTMTLGSGAFESPAGVFRSGASRPTGFRTSKGSTYEITPEGSTVRNKAARPDAGHEGTEGIYPASKRTIYMPPEEMNKLSMLQTYKAHPVNLAYHDESGNVGVLYGAGPNAGKIDKRTVAKFSTTPEVGLHPVEDFGDQIHFGNEITELFHPKAATHNPIAKESPHRFGKGWFFNTKDRKLHGIDPNDLGPHGDHDGWISIGDNAEKLGVDPTHARALQASIWGHEMEIPEKYKEIADFSKDAGFEGYLPPYEYFYHDGRLSKMYEDLFQEKFGMHPDNISNDTNSVYPNLIRVRKWPASQRDSREWLSLTNTANHPLPSLVKHVDKMVKQDPSLLEGVNHVVYEGPEGSMQQLPLSEFLLGERKRFKRGGIINKALRLTRDTGGPVDESSQEAFLREQLKDSAPQYDPEGGMRTAKRLALDAYGMTDLGGAQEALGYMPKPEGGFEKSALQHAKEGNYGTAGLLALGAIVPGAGKLGKLAKVAERPKYMGVHAMRSNYLPHLELTGGHPNPSIAILNPQESNNAFFDPTWAWQLRDMQMRGPKEAAFGDTFFVAPKKIVDPSVTPVYEDDIFSAAQPDLDLMGKIYHPGRKRDLPGTAKNISSVMNYKSDPLIRAKERFNLEGTRETDPFYYLTENDTYNKFAIDPKFKSMEHMLTGEGGVNKADKRKAYNDFMKRYFPELSSRQRTIQNPEIQQIIKAILSNQYPSSYGKRKIEDLKQFRELLETATSNPSEKIKGGYFEAKPQRAIMPNEWAGALIPERIKRKATPILRDLGIPYKTYSPSETVNKALIKHYGDYLFSNGGAVADALRLTRRGYATDGSVEDPNPEYREPPAELDPNSFIANDTDNAARLDVGDFQRKVNNRNPMQVYQKLNDLTQKEIGFVPSVAEAEKAYNFFSNKPINYQERINNFRSKGTSTVTDPEGRTGTPVFVAGTTPEGKNIPLTNSAQAALGSAIARVTAINAKDPSLSNIRGTTYYDRSIEKDLDKQGKTGQFLTFQPGYNEKGEEKWEIPGDMTGMRSVNPDYWRRDAEDTFRQRMADQNTLAHEVGHALHNVGGVDLNSFKYKMPADVRKEFTHMNTYRTSLGTGNDKPVPFMPKDGSHDAFYVTMPEEMFAEAMRRYMANPAAFKRMYPNAAKYMRSFVNTNPKLNKLLMLSKNEDSRSVAKDGGVIQDALRLADGGGEIPLPPDRPSREVLLTDEAANKYPFIKKFNPSVSFNPSHPNPGGWIAETFGAGNKGYKGYDRPSSAPLDSTAIEIYKPDKMSANDIAAEFLHVDPRSHATRKRLMSTFDDRQREMLREQGDYAAWPGLSQQDRMRNVTDALMRGYVMGQWPKEAIDQMNLTKQQRKYLDDLKRYTTTEPRSTGGAMNDKVKDALRLAHDGKYRLHQTLARTGYAGGGIANNAAKELLAQIDDLIPHMKKGGRIDAEPEPGSDEYWAQKGLTYMRPYSVRKEDPKDPMRYISPKEYQKGNVGHGEYVMADGGRVGYSEGGAPTDLNPTGNPVVAANQPIQDPTKQYVQSLYKNVMGREGDQPGVDYWTNQLQQGNVDQPGALQNFAQSAEFQNLYKQDPSKAVSSLYQTALARTPDQAGVDYWTQQAKQGMDLGQMVSGFTGSQEGKEVQDANALYQTLSGQLATPEQIQQVRRDLTPQTDFMDYVRKTFPMQESLDGVQEAKNYRSIVDATPFANKSKIWGNVTAAPITEGGMKFLDMIGSGEGGYDTVRERVGKGYKANYNYSSDDVPLSQLTVGDVMKLQQAGKFRAAGKYQFMPDVLYEVAHQSGIDPNQKFDQKTQDQLAMFRAYSARPKLMAYLEGRSNDLRGAMLDLANEWRSFPDPRTGRSVSGGNNSPQHTLAETKQMLTSLRGPMFGESQAVDPAIAEAAKDQTPAQPQQDLFTQAWQKYQSDLANWNNQANTHRMIAAMTGGDPNLPWHLQMSMPQPPNRADYPAGAPATGIKPIGETLAGQGAGGPTGTPGNTGVITPGGAGVGIGTTTGGSNINNTGVPGSGALYQPPGSDAQALLDKAQKEQSLNFLYGMPDQAKVNEQAFYDKMQGGLANVYLNSLAEQAAPNSVMPLYQSRGGVARAAGGAIKPDKEDISNALRLAKGGRRVNARIDKDPAFDMSLKSGGGAWTRKEGQNPAGGLNAKGRASAKAEGHNLKPPAPHPKTDADAARRKSFCSRMQGMKEKLTSAETAKDPNSRINKSLRAWNC